MSQLDTQAREEKGLARGYRARIPSLVPALHTLQSRSLEFLKSFHSSLDE